MAIPIPEKKTALNFAATYSPAEFEKIREGFKPQELEKWLIIFKDPWLYFRRIATGNYIYGVRFCREGPDFTVVESWCNADRAQFRSAGAQHDEAMLKFLISSFLLGKPSPFPMPPDISPEKASLYQWHVAGDLRPGFK